MKLYQICWVICSTLLVVNAAPKPSAENTAHGNKDPDDDDIHINIQTTLAPSDLSVDLPENWDQAKDDSQSLFINKNDKNDLEPYPMALSDDVGDVYDGQPISANGQKLTIRPRPEVMEHVIMRAELYGEPPSMGRQPSRKKRAESTSFRSSLSSGNSRVNKRGTRYSAMRIKRDTNMNDELRTLITLWDAEQRRIKEEKENYYNPASYYSQFEPYEDAVDESNYGDMWLDEPVITPSHFSNYYDPLYEKPSHYKYPQTYSNYKIEEPEYIQHLEAIRRKRQWAGFNNKNRLSKRFMVAKKRSEPNQYYYTQKSFKPREDLYSLSELLKSTQNIRDQGIPVSRRMIL